MAINHDITALHKAFAGRRVLSVERRVYEDGTKADYPVFNLDDGSEVIILDSWGFPPLCEVEKSPWVESPLVWQGD